MVAGIELDEEKQRGMVEKETTQVDLQPQSVENSLRAWASRFMALRLSFTVYRSSLEILSISLNFYIIVMVVFLWGWGGLSSFAKIWSHIHISLQLIISQLNNFPSVELRVLYSPTSEYLILMKSLALTHVDLCFTVAIFSKCSRDPGYQKITFPTSFFFFLVKIFCLFDLFVHGYTWIRIHMD